MMYLDSLDNGLITELVDMLGRLNPVEIVTPANANEIKPKWIENVIKQRAFVNPSFHYDREYLSNIASYHSRLITIKSHLEQNVIPESCAERILLDILSTRIEQGIKATELAVSILFQNDVCTSEISQSIYGAPTPAQITECYRAVGNTTSSKPRFTESERAKLKAMSFGAEEIRYWFARSLDFYRISPSDWTIEVGDQYTAIDVRAINSTGHPVVGIPTNRKVNGLKLLELIGHEIACHLIGVENARHLFLELLGEDSPLAPLALILAKSSDELLDEGRAKHSDVAISGTNAMPSPYYSIAISLARQGCAFRYVAEEIFNIRIATGSSIETAARLSWTNTYRVFRGSTRPGSSEGYAFTKDFIYYAGYDIVKNINPIYLDYASMSIDELEALFSVLDMSTLKCKYPNLDIVAYIKDELLSK
ncbi:DUF1704 domain-containing protein [Candidatus Saccharibacteria bacterium]|nr:DUF1704 domain-containing protein [Candidatus Saccharibacteria bacterium]